jgi:hypothetical protein
MHLLPRPTRASPTRGRCPGVARCGGAARRPAAGRASGRPRRSRFGPRVSKARLPPDPAASASSTRSPSGTTSCPMPSPEITAILNILVAMRCLPSDRHFELARNPCAKRLKCHSGGGASDQRQRSGFSPRWIRCIPPLPHNSPNCHSDEGGIPRRSRYWALPPRSHVKSPNRGSDPTTWDSQPRSAPPFSPGPSP